MVNLEQIEFLDKVFVRRPFFDASAYRVERLGEVLKTHVFKNAVWLSSPEFYHELAKKQFDFGLLGKKERLTALKFYNRMSFRATPFGAFSAFGLAGWDSGNGRQGILNGNAVLHVLPAVELEWKELASRPLTGDVLIAVNPTLYVFDSGWRYARYEADQQGKLSFYVYALRHDPVDELLLARLGQQPVSLDELTGHLMEWTDCTEAAGRTHVLRLVDEQVLITSNSLPLLRAHSGIAQYSVAYWEDLELPGFVSGKAPALGAVMNGRSLYAGLEWLTPVSLPDYWQKEMLEALQALDLLARIPPKNDLDKFREAFEQKFGERGVPLLEALDPDLGVAYDEGQPAGEHALLKGLEFQQEQGKANQLTWTPVHQLLMKAWFQDAKRSEWGPVVLTPGDLADLPGNNLPFPPSISIFCSVAENKLVFQNTGGASANTLIGRFSAFSEGFDAFCKRIAKLEAAANPGIWFAEILQVNHQKVDNINRRRQVYDHCLPLNTFPREGYLLPKDLDVRVTATEIILVHRPTGKRVVPRQPTAFNYHHSDMPLYRFLCALQFKSIRANFDFDPGKVFPDLNFYPRIEYGRTVLSLARWYLNKQEVESLVAPPLSISRLHLFCRKRGIPALISAGRGDQQLVFNLANDEEATFFLASLHDESNHVLTELIGTASGEKNGHTQFVVSLLNRDTVFRPQRVKAHADPIVRDFDPGSEWVYMKIYATYQSMEHILLEILFPWICRNEDRIRQWFFVRYEDSGSHLRVRFRVELSMVKDLQFELQALLGPVRLSGLVQKAYFDTYQREIERYSAELIGDVEQVFYRGSEWVCRHLMAKNGEPGLNEDLWPIVHAFQIVTGFFGGDWEGVMALCHGAAAAFFREHGGGKKLKRSMDDRFRALRPELARAIESERRGTSAFTESLQGLSRASAGLERTARQKLVADIVHMQVNRIFSDQQRRHEALIWHCLSKVVVTMSRMQMPFGAEVMDSH